MAQTRVRAEQILGLNGKNLRQELEETEHYKPSVEAETDLPSTGGDGEIRLIKGLNKFMRFDISKGKWEAVSQNSGGTLSNGQWTKLDVVASSTSPHLKSITIKPTQDFKLPPIEVLKFKGNTVDVVTIVSNFNNADSTDFEANNYVKFDGTLNLKMSYSYAMTKGTIDKGVVFSHPINKSEFKKIEKIEVK